MHVQMRQQQLFAHENARLILYVVCRIGSVPPNHLRSLFVRLGVPSTAPYSSTSLSTTNSTAAGGVSAPHAANKNTVADSTGATGTGAAAAPSSSPPPPRTKCDPFEQGGHPLATPVVLQHMRSALDEAWSYDEERKMLLRTFSFLREFGGPDAPPHSDTRALFDFVAALGNVQIHSQGPANHGIYNVNLNLRANSVQVILKTRQLAGCSWADLALGTKVDGIFFRAIMARDAKREMQRKKEQAAAAAAARVQKTTNTQPESSL